MIIGADRLGSIDKNLLHSYGITSISHVAGRKPSERSLKIPQATSLVVVLTDFINHCTAKHIKQEAKSHGIPTVFAKRSWCSLNEQLEKCNLAKS
jgi:hypothetical protein